MAKAVLMVGHSNHSIAAFLEILEHNAVKHLVDVRERPRSRFAHFCQPDLSQVLQSRDITYTWMPRLGGLNPLPRPALETELQRILPPPPGLCLMCAEGDFRQCHRHQLLAPIIRELGYRVVQILRDGSTEEDTGDRPEPEAPQLALF